MQDLRKIEKVQFGALRHVYNDFTASYSTLREKSNRPLMNAQRLRQMMIEVCKVYHNTGPVYMGNLFNKADQLYITRCVKLLEQPSFNTITYG